MIEDVIDAYIDSDGQEEQPSDTITTNRSGLREGSVTLRKVVKDEKISADPKMKKQKRLSEKMQLESEMLRWRKRREILEERK